VPVLTQFRDEMNRVRERELAVAMRKLPDLTPEQRATIEYFSQSMMNKFMHEPSVRLRAAAANGRGLGVVDAARYLFALDERAAPPPPAPAAAAEDIPDPAGER
jgi:glutamyl-tRNA reductase